MTTADEEVPDEPVVNSVDTRPCGCLLIQYANGKLEADLCIPCALSNAGDMLKHVAKKMAQREMVEGQ